MKSYCNIWSGIKKVKIWIPIWLLVTLTNGTLLNMKIIDSIFIGHYSALFICGICIYLLKFKSEFKNDKYIILFWIVSMIISVISLREINGVWFMLPIIHLISVLYYFDMTKIIANKYLLWVGKISYSFYLIHGVLGYNIICLLLNSGLNSISAICITIIIILFLSFLINKFVERPSQKFLNGILINKWASTEKF